MHSVCLHAASLSHLIVFVQSMKKGGLDKATAQRILKVWEETGASSPEGLRKLLLGRSLRTVGVVALQLLLDAGESRS